LLDPVVDFIERKGASRTRAITAVFAMALVLVPALFGSIVPQLVSETRDFAERVPDYASRLGARIEFWINQPHPWVQRLLETKPATSPPHTAATNGSASGGVTNVPLRPRCNQRPREKDCLEGPSIREPSRRRRVGLPEQCEKIGGWLFGRVASWFGVLAGLALIPVYAFLLPAGKRGITSRWTDYLPVSDSCLQNEFGLRPELNE